MNECLCAVCVVRVARRPTPRQLRCVAVQCAARTWVARHTVRRLERERYRRRWAAAVLLQRLARGKGRPAPTGRGVLTAAASRCLAAAAVALSAC